MSEQKAIALYSVSKTYKARNKSENSLLTLFKSVLKPSASSENFKALDKIDFRVQKGEAIGIIGRNGSGKSTLLNLIMGSIKPDKGSLIETQGRKIRLALGMGVDNNLSGRDNIYVNGSVLGMSFKKIGKIFDDIVSYADLERFIDTPVKYYSKGMRQRLLFSIAMHAEADIFLLDEFFGGVGDQDFKKKSEEAFQEKILEGSTIIFVSHNMHIIKKYCSRVIWIHKGKIEMAGETDEVIAAYMESFKKMKEAIAKRKKLSHEEKLEIMLKKKDVQ